MDIICDVARWRTRWSVSCIYLLTIFYNVAIISDVAQRWQRWRPGWSVCWAVTWVANFWFPGAYIDLITIKTVNKANEPWLLCSRRVQISFHQAASATLGCWAHLRIFGCHSSASTLLESLPSSPQTIHLSSDADSDGVRLQFKTNTQKSSQRRLTIVHLQWRHS